MLQTLVKHVSRLEREKETAAAQRRDDQEAAEARSRARNVVHTPQSGVSLVGRRTTGKEGDGCSCATSSLQMHRHLQPFMGPACRATLLLLPFCQASAAVQRPMTLCADLLSLCKPGPCRCMALSGRNGRCSSAGPQALAVVVPGRWPKPDASCCLQGLASLPKHKSRLEQEKDAAVAAQATAGPSKPLPSYMRPTSASQAMKKVLTALPAVQC